MGVPPSSVNCLEGAAFLLFGLGADAMRVPRPAAGIITTTFIAGCKYKAGWRPFQIGRGKPTNSALFLRRFPQLDTVHKKRPYSSSSRCGSIWTPSSASARSRPSRSSEHFAKFVNFLPIREPEPCLKRDLGTATVYLQDLRCPPTGNRGPRFAH